MISHFRFTPIRLLIGALALSGTALADIQVHAELKIPGAEGGSGNAQFAEGNTATLTLGDATVKLNGSTRPNIPGATLTATVVQNLKDGTPKILGEVVKLINWGETAHLIVTHPKDCNPNEVDAESPCETVFLLSLTVYQSANSAPAHTSHRKP